MDAHGGRRHRQHAAAFTGSSPRAERPATRCDASVAGMLDHLSLQCADVDAAATFYTRVFAPCGVRELMRHNSPGGAVVGLCGPDDYPRLWLGGAVDHG